MSTKITAGFLVFLGLATAVLAADEFPFAEGTFTGDALVPWTFQMARTYRDKAIGNLEGATSIAQKDNAADAGTLAYKSPKVERRKIFKTTVNLEGVQGFVYVAIHADDTAILTVRETVVPVEQKYELYGTALWNKGRSYKEFAEPIVGGKKYELILEYSNTANLTDKYKGLKDYDGVNVFLISCPLDVRIYDTDLNKTDPKNVYRTARGDLSDPTGSRTKAALELKVAQWCEVFQQTGSGTLGVVDWKKGMLGRRDLDYDLDSFFIRYLAPPPAKGGKYKVFVSVDDDKGNPIDYGAPVELEPVPGSPDLWQSRALSLVSDTADDRFELDGKEDGDLGDRTFLAKLGAQVRVELINPNPAERAQLTIPVPVLKTVKVKGFILRSKDGKEVIDLDVAKEQLRIARERFAQCGIDLQGQVSVVPANPKGVDFGLFDSFECPDLVSGKISVPNDSKALFDGLPVAQDEIAFYYVDYMEPKSSGISTVAKAMDPKLMGYANKAIISANADRFSLAHEFLHILMNAVHQAPYNDFMREYDQFRFYLWSSGANGNLAEPFARKRVRDEMMYRALNSTYAK